MLADNELDLESKLKELGLDLLRCRERKEKKSSMFSKVRLKDLIVFCLHMEQLDRAGVPVHEALADARDASDSPKMKDVLSSVYESVKSGIILSEALRLHPNVFNDVFVGLIAAGEKTGNLSESFMNLVEHMKWTNDLRRKVKKAIAYPIVLMVVLGGVITILMLFVVPKLIKFIMDQGFSIPIHTRALIAFSDFFGNYWYIVLPTPVILAMILVTCYKVSDGFAYRFDSMMLKIPVIGPTVRKINMARFTHFFAVMFNSGIDILDSLKAGQKVVGNRVIKESIDLVHKSVTEGNRLTDSIRISNQFPNLVVRMFKIGEDSGNLSESLENINFFYHREVNDAVDAVVGLIQPALTIVMGSLIFWVIAAVFGPLYDSFSKMKF
ncbi:MAG: type II secretion system F family protein [Rickettsiales bacterium]